MKFYVRVCQTAPLDTLHDEYCVFRLCFENRSQRYLLGTLLKGCSKVSCMWTLSVLFCSLDWWSQLNSYPGRMRCLAALAKWEELSDLCRESWVPTEVARCREMAPMVHNLAQLHLLTYCYIFSGERYLDRQEPGLAYLNLTSLDR